MIWLILALLGCPQPTDSDSDTAPAIALTHAPVSGVQVSKHTQVGTILWVDWTQDRGAEKVWVEYSLDGEWLSTPARPLSWGKHRQALLGLPERTRTEVRLVAQIDGERLESEGTWTATTGRIADLLPAPQVSIYQPDKTSPERYILGSIDVTAKNWYDGPFYLFIMDRQGRIVWDYEVPGSKCAMVPRVAKDGSHVVFNASSNYTHWDLGTRSVMSRTTLDLQEHQTFEVQGNHLHFDEVDDGSLLMDVFVGDQEEVIQERAPDGSRRTVWSCTGTYGNKCFTNTINWVPQTDTVLYSQYQAASIMEVDRSSGELLRVWGERGDYTFVPPEHAFHWQHFPTITPEGNLLISTHLLHDESVQVVLEYAIDDQAKTLTTVWSWGWDDPIWAKYSGEANRLANGNTLVNYGTEGWIRELTPEGEVVWEVWFGDELLLGHNTLVDDLYALNQGGWQH